MRATELPSGRQYTLVTGDARATIVEVGAGLRSYVAGGRELLDGYAEDERPTSARGQPLIPWPNRLRDGRYRWDGEEHQAPLTEPEKGNAIHGYTRFANWVCLSQRTDEVALGYLLHPQPGYPFTLSLQIHYKLEPKGLTVTTTARNVGDQALPYAAGQHPYLAAPAGRVNDCTLVAPGTLYLPTDERGLPTGKQNVHGTEYDFREPRQVGEVELDVAFTGLVRDGDGRAWVRLTDASGVGAAIWVDETYPYVELFTGDSLPEEHRRRRGLGVEPMTVPPNALQSGEGVRRLEPGESATTAWGMCPLA